MPSIGRSLLLQYLLHAMYKGYFLRSPLHVSALCAPLVPLCISRVGGVADPETRCCVGVEVEEFSRGARAGVSVAAPIVLVRLGACVSGSLSSGVAREDPAATSSRSPPCGSETDTWVLLDDVVECVECSDDDAESWCTRLSPGLAVQHVDVLVGGAFSMPVSCVFLHSAKSVRESSSA